MAERSPSDRNGRYVTRYDGNYYISNCACARQGRSAECRCGEEQEHLHWYWDPLSTTSDTNLQHNGREAIFHPSYSSGTAAIRGTEPLGEGQHFWEIKMTTPVYGTDMMIGVGTKETKLDHVQNKFTSLLGQDVDSWGLSYQGTIYHNGAWERYAQHRVGQGTVIGLHLDTWHGTLSYYLNGQPQGLAFDGLQRKELFPVISSTAARSGMKVISTRFFPNSLQFMCAQQLRKWVKHSCHVVDAVDLPPGLSASLRQRLDWLLRPHRLPAPHRRPMKRGGPGLHHCQCQRISCNNCLFVAPLSLDPRLASQHRTLGGYATEQGGGDDGGVSSSSPGGSNFPNVVYEDDDDVLAAAGAAGRRPRPVRRGLTVADIDRLRQDSNARVTSSTGASVGSCSSRLDASAEEGVVAVVEDGVAALSSVVPAGGGGGGGSGSCSSTEFVGGRESGLAEKGGRNDSGCDAVVGSARTGSCSATAGSGCGSGSGSGSGLSKPGPSGVVSTSETQPLQQINLARRQQAGSAAAAVRDLDDDDDEEEEDDDDDDLFAGGGGGGGGDMYRRLAKSGRRDNDPRDNSNDSLSLPLPTDEADYSVSLPVAPLSRDIDDYSLSHLPIEYSLSLPLVPDAEEEEAGKMVGGGGGGGRPLLLTPAGKAFLQLGRPNVYTHPQPPPLPTAQSGGDKALQLSYARPPPSHSQPPTSKLDSRSVYTHPPLPLPLPAEDCSDSDSSQDAAFLVVSRLLREKAAAAAGVGVCTATKRRQEEINSADASGSAEASHSAVTSENAGVSSSGDASKSADALRSGDASKSCDASKSAEATKSGDASKSHDTSKSADTPMSDSVSVHCSDAVNETCSDSKAESTAGASDGKRTREETEGPDVQERLELPQKKRRVDESPSF